MRNLGIWDRAEAAIKHIEQIHIAHEHNDPARARSHGDIIRDHLREIQETADEVLSLTLISLGAK
jgi:hypothetical protein